MKSDLQLIEDTLVGCTAGFGQLVERYRNRLCIAMTQVVGHPEEAEDAVQEALVQAYIKLNTFRRASSFYTWVYRIALNRAISSRRRRGSDIDATQALASLCEQPADRYENPLERLQRKERQRQVRSALASLTPQHREVLVLREMEDCSYETMSRLLDVPIGTIRSRLARARLQLQKQLEPQVGDEFRVARS